MDTNTCRLCLISKNEIIDLFGDEGTKYNIVKKLVQHFWFQVHRDDNLPNGICRMCWKYVKDFHEFYKNIEIIHKNHFEILQLKNVLKMEAEIAESYESLLSFNNQSKGEPLIESLVEIKQEDENYEFDGDKKSKRGVAVKDAFHKTSKKKSLAKTLKTKLIKNKNIQSNILKKILPEDIKKEDSDINTETEADQQSTDNEVVFIENQRLQEKDENDEKQEKDQNDEKLDNNSVRAAQDIKIREFYDLTCEICSSKHSTVSGVKKHYREAHNCKTGYILCCKKKLFKRGQLLEHMFWHTNPDEFKCKVCNQIYADKTGLKIHMHFHSTPAERKYICDICDASFSVRYHLMGHFRKTHLTQTVKKYKCNQCNKSFNKNSVLQSHIRGVHEFKYVNICQICAKVYKSKQQYEKHYLDEHINANKPKLQCNLCGSMLKNEMSLKCHMRRKHLVEPKECKLCGKITSNKDSLQNHMRYVHAERKFKCNLCDKAFKKPIGLKEHMATHSGNSILYTCPYCITTFNSQANMHSHRKKKHPDEWLADRQRRLGITATK